MCCGKTFSVYSMLKLRCSWLMLLVAAIGPTAFSKPPVEVTQSSSSPIAITSDDRQVWVVNPDNNSVSVINIHRDANRKIDEIAVGQEPRFLAIGAKDRNVFVSNSRDGTVTMI